MSSAAKKPTIVLYLHMHQPWRVRPYSLFEVGQDHEYYGADNERVFKKVADKSYRPMLTLLGKLLKQHPDFCFSLSVTGTFLEHAEHWGPDIIAKLQDLVKTGRVEIVAETYYHSLAFFYDETEFEQQIKLHQAKIKELFGIKSTSFRNTELAYNDALAEKVAEMGFKSIVAEGWDKILGWRGPGYVYNAKANKPLRLLLKNYRLSDDIAFRFSDKKWSEHPLSAQKYLSWAKSATAEAPLLNLFMDFETFGEHQWADTGIFEFFEKFVEFWLKDGGDFATISEAAEQNAPKDTISMPETVTWADTERDLSAWVGNAMQRESLRHLYSLLPEILQRNDKKLLADFRNLTTSDHVYYMCTKYWNDGDVHAYFSAYESPYDAFLFVTNAIRDLEWRAKA
ncbi:MAG: glycoside hydrolase family 57 protein [Candidatus Nomurabacteria bacterium]|jgi:alpha-amylase|nr:glycoside hydrolase family 57 protein [Candidatus Nomurabacteria bacterium]